MMIQEQFRAICPSKAQAVLPQVVALPEENVLQSNRKTVHRVYLEWRAVGSGPFTPAQWAAISPTCRLTLYTASGISVLEQEIPGNTLNTTVDVSALSVGLYYYIVQSPEFSLQRGKIIIIH